MGDPPGTTPPARVLIVDDHELAVSLNTVKTHVVHILGRLEVQDRTQAAVRAVQLGLLDETPST